MVRQEGFEPPAPRSEVWCSIQLSYWRLPVVYHTQSGENNRPL